MRRLNELIFVTLIILILTGCDWDNSHTWQLVWSDEFDYSGLPNESKWNYDTIGNSYGWGNNELQHYTAKEIKNVFSDGGILHIIALQDTMEGLNYTSARLTTKGKGDWLYGKVEVRAKVASGQGIWPAIWMLPSDWEYGGWPRSGEIDIMEHVGYDADSIFTTVHTEIFNHTKNTQVGSSTYVPDSESAFKVYGIEWNEEKIDFFIDDQMVFTFTNSGKGIDEWPFDQKFHLVLNVAVGGNWGGIKGVDNEIFPASMQIDYVRVYQ